MDNPYNTGSEKGSSVLGPTLEFKGELTADEDLLIHGSIKGSIKHSSNLKIGKEGKIDAEVQAEYIEVHGTVTGDLIGRKSIVVRDSANVSGNIISPKVSLHEGANFNGSIDMSEPAADQAEEPAPEQEASEPVDQLADDDDVAPDNVSDDSDAAPKRKVDAA